MKLLHYPVLDSTNNKAKELVLQGESDNFVIIADEQTGGRGQQGKTWESPRGGLYLTLVVKWEKNFKINLTAVPLTFGELISNWCKETFGFCPQVKWPNDLYFSGRKLSGILCEKFQSHILVGIGLNLNQKPLANSISVSIVNGQSIEVDAAQKSLFKYLDEHSHSLFKGSFDPKWFLYQKAWLSDSSSVYVAEKIHEDGALELSSLDSKSLKLFSADHSFSVFTQAEKQRFYVMLDVGNSRIKASLFSTKSDDIQEYSVGKHTEISKKIIDWHSRYGFQLVVSVSVNEESVHLLQQELPNSFCWLKLSKFLPYLKTNYQVSHIGLDRLAAMEAAGFLVGRHKPMVVVSAGTAMTVDLVSHGFQHIGGYICAGLSLKLSSLSDCSLLPAVELPEQLSNTPPTKTADALAYGAVHESVAFIQNMLVSLGEDVELVLTGGDGLVLKPYFPKAIYEEKLIAMGGNFMFRGGYLR